MSVIEILKPHNLEAFREISKMIDSGMKKIAIPRATGSGKTFIVGALAEQYNDDRKLVLEPSKPLLDSIRDNFTEFGIDNTDFITYQKLARMSDEDIVEMDYKLIFLDEFHHGTAPKWGQKIEHLMATHTDSIICGTSATVIRGDGVNVVDSLFDGNAIDELSLSTAIARKVLPCPTYVTAIYRLNDELDKLRKKIENSTNTKEEKKEFFEKMQTMKNHFEKSYGVPTILNKYIRAKSGKFLVFCKNKEHLNSMRDVVIDWFKISGVKNIHSYTVYSDYPDKEKEYKAFCEDESDSVKLLYSINMLNEGLHIENISGVLMLRTTMSDIVYRQQLGRVLEAGNLGKHPLVLDLVNNFSSAGEGIGLLREIKDAVAREKEENPEFDDSWADDIDTFFVLENVLEIQEMFAEIEGKLQGNWDLHIKALKQYKEREGDCLVPENHVEIVDEVNVSLGRWCRTMRSAKKEIGESYFTKNIQEQLAQVGFVWDVHRYRFEENLKSIMKFYKNYGEYPSNKSKSLKIRKLGIFLQNEKLKIRKKGYLYPEWRMELFSKYLPDFSSKRKVDEEFNNKMVLAREATKDGELINNSNQIYKGVNLYKWIFQNVKRKYEKNKLSTQQIDIIENLVGKPLNKLFNNGNFVKIIDVIDNKDIAICNSYNKAVVMMQDKFNLKMTISVIYNRISGKVTTPYKGRFMFYYASDEEIRKYLNDEKEKKSNE